MEGDSMKNRSILLVSACIILFMTHIACARDVDVPVGGDIQQAIDDVSSAGGGTVNLAAGVHQIDTSIKIKSNVTLNGTGSAATTIQTNQVIKSIEQASEGMENVTIRNLNITGVAVHGSHAISHRIL